MKVKRTALAAILVVFAVLGVYPGAGQNKNALPNEARFVPAMLPSPGNWIPFSLSQAGWNAAASTRVYLRENGATREIRFYRNAGYEYDKAVNAYVVAGVSIISSGRYEVRRPDGTGKEYYLDANRFLQPK